MISQISDYNHELNTFISSKNLLMFTLRNRAINRYRKFTYNMPTICKPKNVLSAGSLCGPSVSSPQSKCPKRTTFILTQKYHVSVSNMLSKQLKCSWKMKTNINFRGQTWPPAKCWFKSFILPHEYHASNFY